MSSPPVIEDDLNPTPTREEEYSEAFELEDEPSLSEDGHINPDNAGEVDSDAVVLSIMSTIDEEKSVDVNEGSEETTNTQDNSNDKLEDKGKTMNNFH